MANKPQGLRIFYPRCQTCDYMKHNRGWYRQLLMTNYFEPNAPESPGAFYNRTSPPMPLRAFYNHLQHHTTLQKRKLANLKEGKGTSKIKEMAPEALIGEVLKQGDSSYEDALDDTIAQFHTAIKTNQIPITLAGGLQALKIKADIVKGQRDTKVDLVKLFSNRGNKQIEPENDKSTNA